MAEQQQNSERATKVLIKKKKKWYTIVSPKELNSVVIGESPASDASLMVGRVFNINLMTLTDDMKKQNTTVIFKVTNVKESTAETELLGCEISPSHVRRLAKRAKDKVDDSFKCETKDGKRIVVKSLLLVRNKVQRGVLTAIRMAARECIAIEAKQMTFIDLVLAVINNDLQKQVKQSVKKAYPVSMAEIRDIQLV